MKDNCVNITGIKVKNTDSIKLNLIHLTKLLEQVGFLESDLIFLSLTKTKNKNKTNRSVSFYTGPNAFK